MLWSTATRALVFAAVGLVVSGAGGRAAVPSNPRLQLIKAEPPTVRGTAFDAGEHVRLVLRRRAGGPRVTEVVADRSGAFVAIFPGVALGRCARFSIVAAGSRGSRATMHRAARSPGCGPGARSPAGPA
jgi:hypothetical protein